MDKALSDSTDPGFLNDTHSVLIEWLIPDFRAPLQWKPPSKFDFIKLLRRNDEADVVDHWGAMPRVLQANSDLRIEHHEHLKDSFRFFVKYCRLSDKRNENGTRSVLLAPPIYRWRTQGME